MKITRDKNNNVAYSLDIGENAVPDPVSYWTPERKMRAVPMLPDIETEPWLTAAANAPATEPMKADLTTLPFINGGRQGFCRQREYSKKEKPASDGGALYTE